MATAKMRDAAKKKAKQKAAAGVKGGVKAQWQKISDRMTAGC